MFALLLYDRLAYISLQMRGSGEKVDVRASPEHGWTQGMIVLPPSPCLSSPFLLPIRIIKTYSQFL